VLFDRAFPQDSALVFAFSEVPGREQSYLFQKRRGLNDSLSVGRVQLLDIDAVEVAECAMQSVSWCSRGSIMYASADFWRRKKQAGTLMSPAEALHQP